MRLLSTTIAAVFLTGLTAAAAAADPNETASVRVGYGDLDLYETAGMRKLSGRVRNAAAEVCGAASPFDMLGKVTVVKCRRSAIRTAMQEIDRRIRQQIVSR